jgi:hypothetical protein
VTELAEIAASDRALRRFGASRHRYEMEPAMRLDADVPEDYRRFVETIGAGGAGPYYGLVSASRAVAQVIVGPWGRGIPIGHLGCGYAAILSLAGPVWIAARAIGVVREIRPSFTAYYVTWLAQLAAHELPESFVPAGVCPLPTALGGYLGICETELGLEPGTIAGDDLTAALGRLDRDRGGGCRAAVLRRRSRRSVHRVCEPARQPRRIARRDRAGDVTAAVTVRGPDAEGLSSRDRADTALS